MWLTNCTADCLSVCETDWLKISVTNCDTLTHWLMLWLTRWLSQPTTVDWYSKYCNQFTNRDTSIFRFENRFGDEELANEVENLMTKELEREAAAFKYVRSLKASVASDTALLKLSAILTHNVGDVDQGLNYWQVM